MTGPARGPMPATVAVTGAGGSLGGSLARRLLRAGHTVRALVREEGDAEKLRALGAEPVVGDVRDVLAVEELVRGSEVVFHLAAWMGSPFDEGLAYAVNVGGTREVVRAAANAGARRVVLASSIAVYGPVREGAVTEETPFWSVGDLYGDTKIAAEEAAREEAARGGVELVVMRPAMIYGPESPSWTEAPFAAISRGLPVVIGDGEDLLSPVFVEDVARAFELAGFHPDAAGEAFNVAAGPATWNEFFGSYARMSGRKLRRVPARVAQAGARAAAKAERPIIAKTGGRPRAVPEMLGVVTSRAVFSGEKARNVLGFVPEYCLEEGMRETEAWLRGAGLLRRPSVALVTGAAGGLGRAVARALAEEGLAVWAADLEAPSPEDGLRPVALDVRSDESIAGTLALIEGETGPPDLLVNVAGVARPGALEAQPFGDVEAHLDVNAYGPLRLARALAPGMRRQGRGRIVNVTSTNGFIVTPSTRP